MLTRFAPLFSGFFLAISAPAFANHQDGPRTIVADAQTLAEASAQLATLAESANGELTFAADLLHETSEGFAVAVEISGVISRNALRRNHHQESATFAEVERDFWQLAQQWNANAFVLSQNAPVLAAYLAVFDDYRRLLYAVYDLHD